VTRTPVAFEELSARAQVHRLRRVALAALEQYPFEARRLRLLFHGYNTSFRVDTTDGRRFAMRINVNSVTSDASLAAELAWLAALSRDTDIVVPTPQLTAAGAMRASVWFDEMSTEVPVVVMSWLPGRDLDEPTVDACRALGRLTARLHEHAESWSPPAGAAFPALDDVLVGTPNLLLDRPDITAAERDVFVAAFERIGRAYDELRRTPGRHSLHADLHGGNVKWLRGRMSVFDFDDACHGAPVHDLAISTYYLGRDPELETALRAGYTDLRPLPVRSEDRFESLVAGRNLLLANDVLTDTNAKIRAIVPVYLRNSAVKLRAFLDTGV
jgi:Ser/Thr protein kinase RdoA (MazF antagonist)